MTAAEEPVVTGVEAAVEINKAEEEAARVEVMIPLLAPDVLEARVNTAAADPPLEAAFWPRLWMKMVGTQMKHGEGGGGVDRGVRVRTRRLRCRVGS